ncbi:MAG: glycosyltransferase [Sphingomonas sp.]|jgi:UDP:flavonoid glycosyltransferase YjiC (YdhE family)|uniref:glycosyltransferase n=1 Tax=Sphingomonas sp. TaxID=28214 RepID=UPI001AC1173D|nr:glycosyltransferase family 1 protein [Sphingomonas sp.]
MAPPSSAASRTQPTRAGFGAQSGTRRIILATVGTQGDLHPFIAIGKALQSRGFVPILAVADDQVGKCRRAGLDAVSILPGFEVTAKHMGLSHEDAVRRIMGNQRVMLEQVLLRDLSTCAAALDSASTDVAAIVASIFVIAAPIVAEKRDVPLVSVILQPMAMLSAFDAPRTPDFWMMLHHPVGAVSARWNRAAYATLRWLLDRLYGRRIDRVRAEHGLPPAGARNLLDPPKHARLRLGCYSAQLAQLPPDAAAATRIVGFPLFDSESGAPEMLEPTVKEFLAAGAPPLIFTLGTFAVDGAGSFYETAAQIARHMGMRAILLVGGTEPVGVHADVLRIGYAPHSLLFSRSAAIVHHGGVGTTGQALRAGRPQLIVPHMGDQHDHAHRIMRLGAGLRLHRRRFTLSRAAKLIETLLSEPSYRFVAERIARDMTEEHGAEAAADAIIRAIGEPRA